MRPTRLLSSSTPCAVRWRHMSRHINTYVHAFLIILLISMSGCSSSFYDSDDPLAKIRYQTPQMVVWMTEFPKGGDLHNHASGANYIEHGLLFAAQQGDYFDVQQMKIFASNEQFHPNSASKQVPCEGKIKDHDCVIRAHSLIYKSQYQPQLLAYLDIVSMRGWHENTDDGQDHFFDTFAHSAIPDWDDQSIALILLRNHQQHIRYVELMASTTPPEVMATLKEKLPESAFDPNNFEANYQKIAPYLEGAQFKQAIDRFMATREATIEQVLNTQGLTTIGPQPDIVVRYISQMKRLDGPYDSFLQAAAYMKASTLHPNIVATNLVQNESGLPALANFETQMAIIDYFWQKYGAPNIALHAGELVLRESPVEPMRDRISQTIIKGHAERIGHGVAIAWESNPAKTMAKMREHGIAVEICLSSNHSILGIKGKDHPLHLYLDAGVPVTLATDDEGVSRSNLTMEYIRAAQEQQLSYNQLKMIAKNALAYSFLGGQGIYDADGNILASFEPWVEQNQPPKISASLSTKQYLQIRHEQDLRRFEAKYLN